MQYQPSSYSWLRPAERSVAQASSRVTFFMRSRMSSGTLGRPSGNLSPCQSGVYLITSSGVKNPCCAVRRGASATMIAPAKTHETNFRIFLPLRLVQFLNTSLLGFEPRRPWNLGLLCNVFVHFHAQPRLVRWSDVTVHDDLALLHPIRPKIHVINPMPFLAQEIRIGRAGMRRGHLSDWRNHAVRRNRNVVGLRHVGNLLGFGESPDLLKVRLDDVDRPLLEQFPVSPSHVEVFAAGDRRGGRMPDIGHRVDVFGRYRLLEPHQAEGLERFRDLLARCGVVTPMHIAGERHVGWDSVVHTGNPLDHAINLAV